MKKLIFAIIFLTGCGIDSGYIVNKKFIKKHTEQGIRMQQIGKSLIPINYTKYYENQYILFIEYKGKKNEIEVNKCDFDEWNVGEWYDKKITK